VVADREGGDRAGRAGGEQPRAAGQREITEIFLSRGILRRGSILKA